MYICGDLKKISKTENKKQKSANEITIYYKTQNTEDIYCEPSWKM